MGAFIDPHGQRHRLAMPARRTGLARVGRIHPHHFSTSLFRFVEQVREEHRPRGIRDRFGPDRSLRLYLGTVDGEPVATVALFFEAGVASINWVVSLPQFRRQGIGAAMTLMAAREARSAGYRVGVLTASPLGITIYRRLGFQEYCPVSTYQWSPTSDQKGES